MKRKILAALLVLILTPCLASARIRIGRHHTTPFNITTTSLAPGQTTVAYSKQVLATGGTTPYTFSQTAGTLPTGLSIAASGVISGTPTVAGKFNFTVHGVDHVGATDNQTLSITITATPVVTPVSISTTSLPNGTVGVPYSTTLTATGGTLPYAWATPSCVSGPAGCWPPGITLNASSGVAGGTPTAAGTSSVTARVTDSSSPAQHNDKAFGLTVAAPSTPTNLFSDGFESGNFSAWDFVWTTTDTVVQSSVKHSGSYAAGIHYYVCGDHTNSACGDSTADINRYLIKDISPAVNTIYVRGYVYFKTPEPGGTVNGTQYKILWVDDTDSYTWAAFLGAWPDGGTIPLSMGENIGSGGTAWTHYDLATLNRNTWYCLELAVHPNTPGVYNDGWYRLWVNGTEVNYGTNDHLHVDFRHNQTGNIGQVRVGDQVQRYNYNVLNEYRYWDDIVVSTSYIGP